MLGAEQKDRYLSDTLRQFDLLHVPAPTEHDLCIVYSALHGAGAEYVPAALARLGFLNVNSLQTTPDGTFGGMQKPNPEIHDVFTCALEKAEKIGAALILATDPDCDRVGVLCKHEGEYVPLTGNQIGALLCDFLLSAYGTENDYIVTTIVSGDLGAKIAQARGARVIRTLTGFKYIGDIAQRESGRFVLGYEESYGYLTGNAARDKDGVLACALIACMASHYREADVDLIQHLSYLTNLYGAYADKLVSIGFTGPDYSKDITRLMTALRTLTSNALSGFTPTAIDDFAKGGAMPPSDVLKIHFSCDAWLAARPSGTEPQMKFYLCANSKTDKDAYNILSALEDALRCFIVSILSQETDIS